MVDIHSHVLYGLDDGSPDRDTSLAMLEIAARAGTTDIVASPHADIHYPFRLEEVERQIEELNAATRGKPRIHFGCDFHLQYDNIQDALAHPTRYTIAHNSYLLVEFSDLVIFHSSEQILDRLIEAGMTPVVTHPERNPLLQQRPEELGRWVARGCLLQVTAQSLLGDFGSRAKEFAEALLKRNLVHFLASDAHDCEKRPPRLDEAHEWVSRKYGPGRADLLCIANPAAAVSGAPLPPENFESSPSSGRRWYEFWR